MVSALTPQSEQKRNGLRNGCQRLLSDSNPTGYQAGSQSDWHRRQFVTNHWQPDLRSRRRSLLDLQDYQRLALTQERLCRVYLEVCELTYGLSRGHGENRKRREMFEQAARLAPSGTPSCKHLPLLRQTWQRPQKDRQTATAAPVK